MNRIRWYGPTVLLLVTVLTVMIAGPGVARRIEHARKSQYITNVRESLEASPSLQALSDSFRKVAQVVEPSVVHIQVSRRVASRPRTGMSQRDLFRRFFGPNLPDELEEQAPEAPERRDDGFDRFNVPQPVSNGSGWVYDNKGHVITNRHVIEDADEITVRFYDHTERKATVVGSDPKTDIAVLHVDNGDLHPAKLADEPVQQGDIVFAFGSPFRFEFSMSQGIVSAKGRQLGILGQAGYEDFIQTDAAINPGNSGGPLTNVLGQVVGMNTAIATRTATYNGLGFAIPADMLRNVIEQILTRGKVTRGYLGIYIKDLDPKMARTFGFEGKGVLVESPIKDGPASAAGIVSGDIITKVEGKPVTTAEELRRRVADYEPGKVVPLTVFRAGKTIEVKVTIAEQPDQMASAESGGTTPDRGGVPDVRSMELLRKLGIESARAVDKPTVERLKLSVEAGVLVESVRSGSVAASVGIRPRSVITDVQGVAVSSVEQLVTELGKHDLSQGVRVRVSDGEVSRFVLLELADQP